MIAALVADQSKQVDGGVTAGGAPDQAAVGRFGLLKSPGFMQGDGRIQFGLRVRRFAAEQFAQRG